MGVVEDRQTDCRLLLACFPKSGSTYLSEVLAHLPGMRRDCLVLGYQRREQELSVEAIKGAIARSENAQSAASAESQVGFVAQHHVRFSNATQRLVRVFGLTPIILVRDIFDAIMSFQDHVKNISNEFPMAYLGEDARNWPSHRLQLFIADMIIPWYFNFFMSWTECREVMWVTYKELVEDKMKTVVTICEHVGIASDFDQIGVALEKAAQSSTRRNKGVQGRGEQLGQDIKDRVYQYAAYYPGTDFSAIGL